MFDRVDKILRRRKSEVERSRAKHEAEKARKMAEARRLFEKKYPNFYRDLKRSKEFVLQQHEGGIDVIGRRTEEKFTTLYLEEDGTLCGWRGPVDWAKLIPLPTEDDAYEEFAGAIGRGREAEARRARGLK